jgi:hypothetical protein
MSLWQQQLVRLLLPGFLCLASLAPIFEHNVLQVVDTANKFTTESLLLIALSLMIGSAYSVVDCRGPILGALAIDRIDVAIIRGMMRTLKTAEGYSDATLLAEYSAPVLDAFYRIVDKDPTLSVRVSQARLVGTIMSSGADVLIIMSYATLLYSVIGLATCDVPFFLACSGTAMLAAWTGLFVVFKARDRMIAIGDRQLRFIHAHLKEEWREALGVSQDSSSATDPESSEVAP